MIRRRRRLSVAGAHYALIGLKRLMEIVRDG
jgi:hypothetical protein